MDAGVDSTFRLGLCGLRDLRYKLSVSLWFLLKIIYDTRECS